jgi:hypothetical protein
MKKIFMLTCLFFIAFRIFCQENPISRHFFCPGFTTNYYTFFVKEDNSVAITYGIQIDYKFKVFYFPRKVFQQNKGIGLEIFLGGTSGFLFDGSNIARLCVWNGEKKSIEWDTVAKPKAKDVAKAIFSFPFYIPLVSLAEIDLRINRFINLMLIIKGGPNLCIYPGISPYFIYSFNAALGPKIQWAKHFGMEILVDFGFMGLIDVWPGFGIRIAPIFRF